MERPFLNTDIRGWMILLGTGTSVGVPMIGCGCPVCVSLHPRNNRTRCAAILGLSSGNLLIDTPPDLRNQLLREKIGVVDAVMYTHEHADHVYGLDDLRLFPFRIGHPVPLYCEPSVERRIRSAFDYAFSDVTPTHAGGFPQLRPISISEEPFEALDTIVTPIRLRHGPRFTVLGFRIGKVAYCTDVNGISEESFEKLEGLDTLVLGTLRFAPHPTHFCVDEALAVVDRLRPRVTYLTHTSHDLEYDATNAMLPTHVQLAYDGQRIPLSQDEHAVVVGTVRLAPLQEPYGLRRYAQLVSESMLVALLDAGANPNDQANGFCVLHAMSWVRKPDRGDDIESAPPPIGSGRLTSLQFVREVVSRGADVNLQLQKGKSGKGILNRKGATPFLLAADTADIPLMRALIELGADPLIPNADRCTPLMAAAGIGTIAPGEEAGSQEEALQAVAMILERGGNIDDVDENGETCMHGAAYKSSPLLIEYLAAQGADIEIWNRQNRYGWTPLRIAEGYRPGNFRPSADTIAALHRVMKAAGVEIPSSQTPDANLNNSDYVPKIK